MPVPNADKPNEGIVGKMANSAANAVNYGSHTVQGQASEASKEANKEQMKGNTPNSTLGNRMSGAVHAAQE